VSSWDIICRNRTYLLNLSHPRAHILPAAGRLDCHSTPPDRLSSRFEYSEFDRRG
jgi:hypothetical protein